MRNFLLVPVVLCFLSSACSKDHLFRVEGRVPDSDFEGSKVYLVALDAPLTRNVDSTFVRDGAFEFMVAADSLDVRILRIPARFPDMIEDLVVVCESGTVTVVMDSISSGRGTRLNDMLQNWKEKKHINDSLQWVISGQLRSSAGNQVMNDSLRIELQKLNLSMLSESVSLMDRNLFNGIGLLIYKVYFDALPDEVRDHVKKITGSLYPERDAQLKERLE